MIPSEATRWYAIHGASDDALAALDARFPLGAGVAVLNLYLLARVVGGLIVRPVTPAVGAYDIAEDSADDEALLVYTDVDTHHTAFEYFDKDDHSLGSYETPLSNESLSFLGVAFDQAVVYRVQVRYGTSALGPVDGGSVDVAVMGLTSRAKERAPARAAALLK